MSDIEQHEHDVAEVFGAARKHHDHRELVELGRRVDELERRVDELGILANESARLLEQAADQIGHAFGRISALEDALSLMPAPPTPPSWDL